mmetsp:Transcript_28673/g.46032  ORF Transcript_28673/g.46032 Transcript_28673/m.46032 type:complete len:105 (-) Transcript_28673:65-379(-)
MTGDAAITCMYEDLAGRAVSGAFTTTECRKPKRAEAEAACACSAESVSTAVAAGEAESTGEPPGSCAMTDLPETDKAGWVITDLRTLEPRLSAALGGATTCASA